MLPVEDDAILLHSRNHGRPARDDDVRGNDFASGYHVDLDAFGAHNVGGIGRPVMVFGGEQNCALAHFDSPFNDIFDRGECWDSRLPQPSNLRLLWGRSGGDDNGFRPLIDQVFDRGLRVEPDYDAQAVQLELEPRHYVAELAPCGDFGDRVQLPAKAAGLLVQHHGMASCCGHPCRFHSSRSTADDRDRLGDFRPSKRSQFQLTAGLRVDAASDGLSSVSAPAAAIVRANAMANVEWPPLHQLASDVRVRNVRPCHDAHVGLAGSDYVVRYLRVYDAANRENRDALCGLLDFRGVVHEGRLLPRHVRLLHCERHTTAHAETDVEEVEVALLLQQGRHRRHLFRSHSIRLQLVGAQAYSDGKVTADARAHRFTHFQREAGPVFLASAVLVCSVICHRRKELLNQITMGAMQLHAVHSRLLHDGRGVGVAFYDLFDLSLGHGVCVFVPRQGLGSGGRPQRQHGGKALAGLSEVEKLDENLGAVPMNGIGQHTPSGNGIVHVTNGALQPPVRGRMHRRTLNDDEAHSSPGAGLVVCVVLWCRPVVLIHPRTVRADQHAIAHFHGA